MAKKNIEFKAVGYAVGGTATEPVLPAGSVKLSPVIEIESGSKLLTDAVLRRYTEQGVPTSDVGREFTAAGRWRFGAETQGTFDYKLEREISTRTGSTAVQTLPAHDIHVLGDVTFRLDNDDLVRYGNAPGSIYVFDAVAQPTVLATLHNNNPEYVHNGNGVQTVKLGLQSHYKNETLTVTIVKHGRATCSEDNPADYLYADLDNFVRLGKGDTVTNKGAGKIHLLTAGGEKLDIAAGGSHSVTADGRYYLASATKGAQISVSVLPAKPGYEAEYSGASGMLSLRRKPVGKLLTYLDAGIGYMLVEESTSTEYLRYLNMAGVDKVKLVSDSEVVGCIVNEG